MALCESVGHYARNHTENLRIIKLIETEAILDKVGGGLRDEMYGYDERAFKVILDIIREGIAVGDLKLQGECSAEGLALAMWVMTDGTIGAVLGGAPLRSIGISDPFKELSLNSHYLMDGFGWRPMSQEYDYAATLERIRELVSCERAPGDAVKNAAEVSQGAPSEIPGRRWAWTDAKPSRS